MDTELAIQRRRIRMLALKRDSAVNIQQVQTLCLSSVTADLYQWRILLVKVLHISLILGLTGCFRILLCGSIPKVNKDINAFLTITVGFNFYKAGKLMP
ncbi:hypothetical protein PoB_002720600 [Plakobranchus ocellatus]|uniref:Uncharacterized protein n=1 Tax=Plakobranchus ocellatus TaxID=259542 RepID=A0AAV3ZNQ0_9GAST|nr:hypothetical protein PoB_002720600 [Plakobranchus ocellatus]